MPIDFLTRKNADRVATTPTAPAADDTMQLQTAALGDRVSFLGNLAGIAPVAVANDQALAYIGGSWASYSLTAAGRALSGVAGTANTFPYFSAANVVTLGAVGTTGLASLAAANQAAGRTALGLGDAAVQNIGTSGATVPLLNGTNTWGNSQFFTGTTYATANLRLSDGTNNLAIFANGGQMFFSVSSALNYRFDGNNLTAAATVSGAIIWPGVTPSSFLYPVTTNTVSCGRAGNLWTAVWSVNAAIQTSDARLKTDPRQLRDAESLAMSEIIRLPGVWRWKSRVNGDENCEPEGKAARKHFGPTVQAAIAVMEAHELDPFSYSFICYDQWEAEPEQWNEWPAKEAVYEVIPAVLDDEGDVVEPERTVLIEPAVEAGRELIQPAREAGDRYSFRKEELLCGMVSALARENDEQAAKIEAQQALLDDLLARVAALEAKG